MAAGAILYLRQKRAKDAFPATGDDKSQDTECGLTGVKISAGDNCGARFRKEVLDGFILICPRCSSVY